MKKLLPLLAVLALLAGCSAEPVEMNRALALRTKLLQASTCTFNAEITADCGEDLYTFGMHCMADEKGEITFQVTKPDSISGITGTLSQQGGALTFDSTALQFELLADGRLSPVSAPWVLMQALRGGFITSAGTEDDQIRLSVNDSFDDDALNLDIWLDEADIPKRVEICCDGKRMLTVCVENMAIG